MQFSETDAQPFKLSAEADQTALLAALVVKLPQLNQLHAMVRLSEDIMECRYVAPNIQGRTQDQHSS